jgi:hypothetical protein
MSSPQTPKSPADWARDPDAQALYETGARLEAEAQQVLALARTASDRLFREARTMFDTSGRAGSLAGMTALVRLVAADGSSFGWAQSLLAEAERRFPDAPRRELVSVAPDVLGPKLRHDGDSEDDPNPLFAVISPYPERAAATLARISPGLMNVDEFGGIQSLLELGPENVDSPYTPNYIWPVAISSYGAQVALDTKGGLAAAMGRTMVELIADALAQDEVPAHIVGEHQILINLMNPWQAAP